MGIMQRSCFVRISKRGNKTHYLRTFIALIAIESSGNLSENKFESDHFRLQSNIHMIDLFQINAQHTV